MDVESPPHNRRVKLNRRKNHTGFSSKLGKYVTEYTENTSLHGVRYLGEKRSSIFERLWWIIVFIVSLYICLKLILKTYHKWENTPVIVSFAQSPTPVWDIPFPAVTICPQTKCRQTAFNFTDYYHRSLESTNTMNRTEWQQFADAALVCDNHMLTKGNESMDYRSVEFFKKIAPSLKEVLWICIWRNTNRTCESLYTPVLTEEGVCFSFNMLDRDDIFTNQVYHNGKFLRHGLDRNGWTLEGGYAKDADLDTFPNRAISEGLTAGMSVVLRGYQQDLDYICKGPIQGFKILLHHPGEVPRVATQFFRVPMNEEIIVTVKPEMMTTSESLRQYLPRQRHCYFSSERELAFYKNYTQQNCEVECLTNYTLQQCGCVAYYMPHNEATPVCANAKLLCMMNARNRLLAKEVIKGLNDSTSKSSEEAEIECDCLPACTSLSYSAELSQAVFDWPSLFRAFKANFSELPGVQLTRLTIFFKEMQFITSTRNELYGVTDFLANCGGLLGLFIGFSFLSAVETFYFLTLRLWCNMRQHGMGSWTGSTNLADNKKCKRNK